MYLVLETNGGLGSPSFGGDFHIPAPKLNCDAKQVLVSSSRMPPSEITNCVQQYLLLRAVGDCRLEDVSASPSRDPFQMSPDVVQARSFSLRGLVHKSGS